MTNKIIKMLGVVTLLFAMIGTGMTAYLVGYLRGEAPYIVDITSQYEVYSGVALVIFLCTLCTAAFAVFNTWCIFTRGGQDA